MASELSPVPFHDDTVEAVRSEANGQLYAVVHRLCDNIGISYSPQRTKLQNCGWANVTMIVTLDSAGRNMPQFCICIDDIPKWLSEIDVNKVGGNLDPASREALRQKLLIYQRECARVLRDYFFGQSPTDPVLAVLEQTKLIRIQQIEHERRLTAAEKLAALAHTEARAALAQATANHGHFSVLGWARLHGREITIAQASQLGKQLTAICRRAGIFTGQMVDPRFGTVQTYPESVLRQYLGDDDEPIPDSLAQDDSEP